MPSTLNHCTNLLLRDLTEEILEGSRLTKIIHPKTLISSSSPPPSFHPAPARHTHIYVYIPSSHHRSRLLRPRVPRSLFRESIGSLFPSVCLSLSLSLSFSPSSLSLRQRCAFVIHATLSSGRERLRDMQGFTIDCRSETSINTARVRSLLRTRAYHNIPALWPHLSPILFSLSSLFLTFALSLFLFDHSICTSVNFSIFMRRRVSVRARVHLSSIGTSATCRGLCILMYRELLALAETPVRAS